MSFPNPWQNPEFYRKVKIGGRPIKARLVAVNGIKIEDEWSEQRPTGNSGATNVFKGTKPAGPVKLTFEAPTEEAFDDLRELWEQLAPKAGGGGNGSGATVGSPGSAAYGKQFTQNNSAHTSAVTATPEDLLKQATQALAALQSGAATTTPAASTAATSSSSSAAATPNPGPKPPTLSIVNGFVNYIGITAVSRKSWEGPIVTSTNSYQVIIELVSQKEPAAAGVGKSAPKSPDNPGKQIAFGEIQDAAAEAKAANQAIAAAGA